VQSRLWRDALRRVRAACGVDRFGGGGYRSDRSPPDPVPQAAAEVFMESDVIGPNVVCVILAGGQGKRMRSRRTHKVCFPIAGKPAILRILAAFKSVGVRRFLVVVGTMAEQVISTVAAEHPDAAFVYQPAPRGTGHAAACAVEVLRSSGYDGNVVVTMGDKVIQPGVLASLLARHAETGADLTLTAVPKAAAATAGRIVTDSRGRVLGVVELPDIRRAAQRRGRIALPGRSLSARQVERSESVNASLYVFRAAALYEATAALRDDNVQGELYLTDTVAHAVSRGGSVATFSVADPDDLMTYNTPEELLKIGEVFARRMAGRRLIAARPPRLSGRLYRPAGQWLGIVQSDPPRLRRLLRRLYGGDESILASRRKAFQQVLELFIRAHGRERSVVLVRAPGRVNLMGRHVDHRGGYVNVMAINREVVVAAAPRDDDVVSLTNVHPRVFPHRTFRIGELLRAADWMDWMDYIDSATVRQVLEAYRGDWSNYAKAAVLRLQHACPDHRLKGMDCVVTGDIPMGAGLSSSSAVVVAMAEAAVALSGLRVTPRQFVDLCGEGEWFVGSRGGSADHAAIRSGERGRVARVGFFPFRIEKTMPFPRPLSLVIANSQVRASKSAGARDTFNQRVATYRLAELLMRKRVAILRSMEHLRDVNPRALGVAEAEIYRLLKRLPERLTRGGARALLPNEAELLDEIFSSHRGAGAYRLRDVAMFGIAECRRSEMYSELLEAGELDRIGEMMRVSHDGDRVVRLSDGRPVRHAPSYRDAALERLMRDAGSTDPARRGGAELWAQPGRYACSTPEIDFIVDLAAAHEGVIGAQLAGAGLGGCAMILAHREAVAPLLADLRRHYYRPRRLTFDVHVCQPVAGSGVLSV